MRADRTASRAFSIFARNQRHTRGVEIAEGQAHIR